MNLYIFKSVEKAVANVIDGNAAILLMGRFATLGIARDELGSTGSIFQFTWLLYQIYKLIR